MRILIATLVLLSMTSEAFARTYLIPNLYNNKREKHVTGEAAGFSSRNTVGAHYEIEKEEFEVAGSISDEDETKTMTGQYFQHFDFGGTVELEYEKADSEQMDTGFGTTESETTSFDLGFGFLLPSGGSIGVQYQQMKEEEDPSFGGTNKSKGVGIGYVHLINERIYVGGGVQNQEDDDGTTKDDDDVFYGGVGFIKGEKEKPLLAGESVLVYRNEDGEQLYGLLSKALMNFDNMQPFVDLDLYSGTSGNLTYTIARGGVDMSFGNLYVAPELQISYLDTDSFYTSSANVAVEGGFRIDTMAAYLRIGQSDTLSASGNVESLSNVYKAGFNYYF